MTTDKANNGGSSFEEMSARLEQIVRQLEGGEVSLEDSIKLFEEGSKLAKNCRKALDDAQLRVTELQKALADEGAEEQQPDDRLI